MERADRRRNTTYISAALAVRGVHLLAFPLVADDLLKLEVDPVVALGIDLVPRVDRLLARPKRLINLTVTRRTS